MRNLCRARFGAHSFKSTNAYQWPQIAFHVYGLDWWGRHVVRGYGSMHVPIAPGRYTKNVRLFTPLSSSPIQQLSAFFTGERPEFRDFKTVTTGEHREVTRVRSKGVVKVVLNVMVKNMADFGYSEDGTIYQSAARTGRDVDTTF